MEVLVEALERFGLELRDIEGLTTDGAKAMKKLGKLLKKGVAPQPFFHLTCLAHALHLAVLDTLKAGTAFTSEPSQVEGNSEPREWNLVGIQDDDPDASDSLEAELEEERVAGPPQYNGTAGNLVARVRDGCRVFLRRPACNDELLDVSNWSGTRLVIDVRTRWNSTLAMLRSFMKQEDASRRYHAREGKGPFPLTDSELDAVREMINALGHVESCTRRLSMKDLTLRQADLALEEMMYRLEGEESNFSKSLERYLCERILQRRTGISALSRFVRSKKLETDLDTWLCEVREDVFAAGDEVLHNTFVGVADIGAEIANLIDEGSASGSEEQTVSSERGIVK